jgi:hypothetical protein
MHLWFTIPLLGFIVSTSTISLGGAVNGLVRFLFAAPVFMALMLFTKDSGDLKAHISTMIVFFAFASLTLPMQFVTGPIPWFAESSTRAGLDRYSSLMGSLTSLGIIVGGYMILTATQKMRTQVVLAGAMAVSAAASLSKSAIMNVAIAVVAFMWLNRRSFLRQFVLFSVGGGALYGAWVLLPAVRERVLASLESFGLKNDNPTIVNYDKSFVASAIDRLTALPLANFHALADLHTPLVYVVGGGYGMGSTALVPESDSIAPMAHNQFAESITVFGFVLGSLQIFVMLAIARLLWKRRNLNRPLFLAIGAAYASFLLNSVFANGTIYQPASASVFYLCMFAALTLRLVQVEDGSVEAAPGERSVAAPTTPGGGSRPPARAARPTARRVYRPLLPEKNL